MIGFGFDFDQLPSFSKVELVTIAMATGVSLFTAETFRTTPAQVTPAKQPPALPGPEGPSSMPEHSAPGPGPFVPTPHALFPFLGDVLRARHVHVAEPAVMGTEVNKIKAAMTFFPL